MRKAAFILMIIPFFLLGSLSAGAAEREERLWQDESVYYIMVDRFMNGSTENNEGVNLENPEAYHGGDLQGVIDQLDYIKDMGFTTIQLSPIMENDEGGFHGFWVSDFEKVEDHFGSMEDARTLVEEAHAKGMKVIFDMPLGFVGNTHPWLDDEEKAGWLMGKSVSNGSSWFDGLPQLAMENENVQQYYQETIDFWKQETGIDGFRLVTPSEVPSGFLNRMQKENTVVFTEVMGEDEDFRNTVRTAFREAGAPLNELTSEENYEEVHQLDSYDTSRFTYLAAESDQNPITRWRLALTYLYTVPGIPQLYYGSEIPLTDGGNLQNVPMMNFKAGDEELKKRVEKLNSMREQFPVLSRGDYEELYNQEGLMVFQRTYQGETIIIAINNAKETKTMNLENLQDDQQLRGLLHDGLVRQQEDGSYRLGLERETADVFVVEQNTGLNWLFIGFVGGVLGLFIVAVTIITLKNRKEEKASR